MGRGDAATRILVATPGTEGECVTLCEGEGVLLGRAPERERAHEAGAASSLRLHALPVPSVSGTHAAVWLSGGRLHLSDLASRNGSWLRLPGGGVATLPAGGEIHLRLGFAASDEAPADVIPPLRHGARHEFGHAVAAAVQRWLDGRATGWSAVVVAAGTALPTGVLSVPLASGEQLAVQNERTVDEHFHRLLTPIARYVMACNTVYESEEVTRAGGMVLASEAILQCHRRVVEAALHGVPRVVLLGPSGTGKECLARAYHRHARREGPLVTVNCATLTAERLVADLFGAEAGAYTGAQRTMIGAAERAHGGTLFLDEIGEMPLDAQAQLLRFLDTGEYQRLGAVGLSRTADVHVLAATNRDLRAMVNDGTFRLDLFFRLGLEVVDVPPLRDRFEDVSAYLARCSLGSVDALDAMQPEALTLLRAHPWPGNFRELVNLVQRLPRAAGPGSIDAATLRRLLDSGTLARAAGTRSLPAQPPPERWLTWLGAAAERYAADHGEAGPLAWSDVFTFVEHYLKPYALASLADVAAVAGIEDIAVAKVSERVQADRGTVLKQLRRYFATRRL